MEPAEGTGRQTLQGYGVQLAIKNMEYKALDDRPLNTQNEEKKKEEETNIEYDEEIEGFLFQTLQKRLKNVSDLPTRAVNFLDNAVSKCTKQLILIIISCTEPLTS